MDQISKYSNLKIPSKDSTYEEIGLKSVFHIGEDLYRFDSIIEFPPAIELVKFPKGYIPIAPQEGYQMPSFAGNNVMTGDSIRIEDYRGKFVYIDVWGSWCAPCVAEIPNIREAVADLAEENIVFMAVGKMMLTTCEMQYSSMRSHGPTYLAVVKTISYTPSIYVPIQQHFW